MNQETNKAATTALSGPSTESEMSKPGISGFVRVTAASHAVCVADPRANAEAIIAALAAYRDSDVVVFGELSLSGYSCGDLFAQDRLLDAVLAALEDLIKATDGRQQLLVVGLPIRVDGQLYNAAAVLFAGHLLGLVPKQFLPNYQEFYEARWFSAANGSEPSTVELDNLGGVPFGIDLLFRWKELIVGVEICEDLWMPVPPSSLQVSGGANLLLNLSASNELVGKADWRELLVRSQSGRCLAAYAYASAGPTESTTDVVFSAHCMIAENGSLLAESRRIGYQGCTWLDESHATADIDLRRLQHDRRLTSSWRQAVKRQQSEYRYLDISFPRSTRRTSIRTVNPTPFVPARGAALERRCSEIFGIQCAALAKRVQRLPSEAPLLIGISGGLDSTLALLVAVKTCRQQAWPTTRIHGLTMPGFGTTPHTLESARRLMQHLQVQAEESDIRELCLNTFRSMNHCPFGIDVSEISLDDFRLALSQVPAEKLHDLTFENVQARMRTLLLMSRGFVLGTGDLSEQALGWSTYNADHMSMYNVNTSIPKTLVRFLVQYVAKHEYSGAAQECLLKIVDTPISPELLPTDSEGSIVQHTESVLGPYELHDFFLYHMIRHGAAPKRILELASLANFSLAYTQQEITNTLKTFLQRFFAAQFKRSCVPDGPKVGSVSLSPRGDWRMPSDAEVAAWIEDLN